jgi:MFS family permease
MATEHAPTGRRGFYGSWPQMGVPAGLLLSTGAFALFSSLSGEQFAVWGWRLPFLVSIVLVGIGLFIRLRILESPAFRQVKESQTEVRQPLLEVLRRYPKNILLATGARLSDTLVFYIAAVFLLAYVTEQLGVSRGTALIGVVIASALELVTIPAYGVLSDRIGRRPVFMLGTAFVVLFAYPFFLLVNTASPVLIWLAIALMINIGHAPTYATSGALLSEMFDTRVRYSGASLSYQISSVISGAPAPLVATALLAWSGGAPWPIAAYVAAGGLLAFISVFAAAETFRTELAEEPIVSPEQGLRGAENPAAEGETAAGRG